MVILSPSVPDSGWPLPLTPPSAPQVPADPALHAADFEARGEQRAGWPQGIAPLGPPGPSRTPIMFVVIKIWLTIVGVLARPGRSLVDDRLAHGLKQGSSSNSHGVSSAVSQPNEPRMSRQARDTGTIS